MKYIPASDIPDLSGKVILITGGTDGIGKETVHQLARHNPAHIYLAARSQSKADTAIEAIKASVGPSCPPIEFLQCELSSLESVRAAAQNFLAKSDRLDILILNAGVLGSMKEPTKEGYEPTFGVNHVAHALLTKLLLPTLQSTASKPEVQKGETRVLFLASDAEAWAPKWPDNKYPYADLKTEMKSASMMSKYSISKLANVQCALALTEKYPEETTGVRFIPLHPGAVSTNLGHGILNRFQFLERPIKKFIGLFIGMVSVEEGAKNSLWAATWPVGKEGEPLNGVYYTPVGVGGKGSKRTTDKEMARDLWEWTEKELAPFTSAPA